MKGLIYKFVMAIGLIMASVTASATVTYVYTDPQGTPLAEADASGTITATFDYKPYGSQALGSPKAGPGYTGHVNDPDTGFVYMQARYYDPVAGRFLSIDPAGISGSSLFDHNRYAYANNSPVMHVDPDGRMVGGDYSDPLGGVHYHRGMQNFYCQYCFDGGKSDKKNPTIASVFSHKTADEAGVATSSGFPSETVAALDKILNTAPGRKLADESITSGEKILLIKIPDNVNPIYKWDAGAGGIVYSTNIAQFLREYAKDPGMRGAGLDTVLFHEFGHTPVGARAFGVSYSPNFDWLNEFDVVRKVENVYRQAVGKELRKDYGNVPVPPPYVEH